KSFRRRAVASKFISQRKLSSPSSRLQTEQQALCLLPVLPRSGKQRSARGRHWPSRGHQSGSAKWRVGSAVVSESDAAERIQVGLQQRLHQNQWTGPDYCRLRSFLGRNQYLRKHRELRFAGTRQFGGHGRSRWFGASKQCDQRSWPTLHAILNFVC